MRVLGWGKPLDYDHIGDHPPVTTPHHAIVEIANGAMRTACHGSWSINERWQMFLPDVFRLVPFSRSLQEVLYRVGERMAFVCSACHRELGVAPGTPARASC